MVHRDVKPANVLVEGADGEERVFLTDFGISRIAGGGGTVTASGELLGSPDYVAPEQIAGDRSITVPTSTPSGACSTSPSPGSRRFLATTTWRSSSRTRTRPGRGPPSWCRACRASSTGSWPGRWRSVPSTATRAPASSPPRWRRSSAARGRLHGCPSRPPPVAAEAPTRRLPRPRRRRAARDRRGLRRPRRGGRRRRAGGERAGR